MKEVHLRFRMDHGPREGSWVLSLEWEGGGPVWVLEELHGEDVHVREEARSPALLEEWLSAEVRDRAAGKLVASVASRLVSNEVWRKALVQG